MNLKQTRYILAVAAAGVLLSGCGGGGGNGSKGIPPISSVNPVQTGTLEFAVGTATIYNSTTHGLNVVATYRQANGLSNVLVDTPTITGPFTLPAAGAAGGGVDIYSTLPGGPSVTEVATGGTITGTSQTLPAGTPACDQTTPCTVTNNATGGTATIQPNATTFGQSGGVFVNGLSPGNYTTQGSPCYFSSAAGAFVPSSCLASGFVPYAEPMYDTTGSTLVPFGGPPAFDPNKDNMGLRDGLSNLGDGVVGIPEGFTVFENVGVNTGTYTMSLVVPTGFNGPTPTSVQLPPKTAQMQTTNPLPAYTAATLPTVALDNNGGANITVPTMPAGVIEEYIQIIDTGNAPAKVNCQGVRGADGPAGPVYYTFVAKAPGVYPKALPDLDGPNLDTTGGPSALNPSESICTGAANTTANGGTATPGDGYSVQVVGLDYDMYGATYPISTSAAPTLTGANGQADITISPVTTGTSP